MSTRLQGWQTRSQRPLPSEVLTGLRATVTGKPWKRAGGLAPASVDVLLTTSQIVVSSPTGLHVTASLSELIYVFDGFGALALEAPGGTLLLEAPKAERGPFVEELRRARRRAEMSMGSRPALEEVVGPGGDTVYVPEPSGGADPRDSLALPPGAFAPRGDSAMRRAVVALLVGIVLAFPLGLVAPHVLGFFYAWITAEFLFGSPHELPEAVGKAITWVVWLGLPPCLALLVGAEAGYPRALDSGIDTL